MSERCQCTRRAGSTRSRPPVCLDCGLEITLTTPTQTAEGFQPEPDATTRLLRDPFKEGWRQGMTQAIIDLEAAAGQADLGGEWGDPGSELRRIAGELRTSRDA